MLVYSDSDILEIRPQQVISSSISIEHPYLKLINEKKDKPVSTRKYTKKQPKDK